MSRVFLQEEGLFPTSPGSQQGGVIPSSSIMSSSVPSTSQMQIPSPLGDILGDLNSRTSPQPQTLTQQYQQQQQQQHQFGQPRSPHNSIPSPGKREPSEPFLRTPTLFADPQCLFQTLSPFFQTLSTFFRSSMQMLNALFQVPQCLPHQRRPRCKLVLATRPATAEVRTGRPEGAPTTTRTPRCISSY